VREIEIGKLRGCKINLLGGKREKHCFRPKLDRFTSLLKDGAPCHVAAYGKGTVRL
jgi:hypothetical protein